jgi:site-specific recombinase XerC
MPKKGESKKQRVSEQIIGPLGDPGSLYFQMKQFLQCQRERGYSERTVGNRESLLIAFIRWCDERGLTRPQEITRPILERYQRHLFLYRKADGEALSARSQTVRITPIRVWFKWLTKTNRILYNPASDLDLPRMEQRLPKHILSSDEAERILNVPDTQTSTGIRDRAMLETLYSTGMRRMELIGLSCESGSDPEGSPTFLTQNQEVGIIEEACMSRQLGLHHTKLRFRTHAGHSIFARTTRSITPLDSFSPPNNAGELCQFVTAGPPPNQPWLEYFCKDIVRIESL